MSGLRRSLPLRSTLAVLLPLATAAAFQGALLPPGPRVPELDGPLVRQRLATLGPAPRVLPAAPAWRSEGVALSSLQRYQLQPGVMLQLQLVQVHRRPDFQLAYVSRPWEPGRQGLALGAGRRLSRSSEGLAEAALQRSGERVRQSCLLPLGSGVTASELAALADRQASGLPAMAARLLGLQPNRSWRCLMVSLHSQRAAGEAASAAAAALWPRLPAALAPLMQPE
jgi:hypothetical protein